MRSSLVSTTNLTWRAFSYYLALFTAGNGLPVFPTIYPVTGDGYRYQVDLRGMDPNGWLVYGNQLGFFDSDGSTPLYHDAVAENTSSPGQLTSIQGGVTFQRPSFPLFFEPPSAAALAALSIPATPTAPIMSALSFAGNLGGNTSLVNNGSLSGTNLGAGSSMPTAFVRLAITLGGAGTPSCRLKLYFTAHGRSRKT